MIKKKIKTKNTDAHKLSSFFFCLTPTLTSLTPQHLSLLLLQVLIAVTLLTGVTKTGVHVDRCNNNQGEQVWDWTGVMEDRC